MNARYDHLLHLTAALAAIPILGSQAAAQSDDTELFSTKVPPNVVFLVDTSGSMREIMYHPAFDSADSTCAIFDRIEPNDDPASPEIGSGSKNSTPYNCDANTNHCRFQINTGDSGYTTTSHTLRCPDGTVKNVGYLERTFCGNTRKLYVDPCQTGGRDTWYSEWYVEWYFSDAADPYFIDSESNTSTDDQMVDANDNGSDYYYGDSYPLYKWSRISAARQIVRDVIYQTNGACGFGKGNTCTDFSDTVRFGVARFFSSHGGYVTAAVDDYSTNRTLLNSAINDLEANSSTPLAESLFKIYTYFMSRSSSDRPFGQDGTTKFPKYSYRLDNGNHTTNNSDIPPQPIKCPDGTACECQKSFVIVISDGDPFNDDFSTSGDNTQGFADFADLIGDYNPDGETETGYLNNGTLYLDDVAMFMQQNDFRPDITGEQVIDTYTVGFNLDATSLGGGLLTKTANVGNGRAFFGTQAAEVSDALLKSVQDIIEKTQSFTSATVPASRATDGNNFFISYFSPAKEGAFWDGHLKVFEFTSSGEVRDKPTAAQAAASQPGDCALEDPVAGRCKTGRVKVELDGFWDAADNVPGAQESGGRDLWVSKNESMTKFDTGLGAGDLAPGLDTTVANYNRFDYDTTGISGSGELADAVIRWVRGCTFQDPDNACVDRGDGRKLWDIFHSNPVVVGAPNAGHRAFSYRAYLNKYKHRKRVIYAGSNGGFVHGFNAGEFGTAQVPDGYDRGTGEEEFGFMSYVARQQIGKLPLDAPRTQYYMDASPSAADVWLDPSRNANLDDPTDYDNWRTVLIGGMRQGGRIVWALDVTNPPDFDSPNGEDSSGPDFPEYLWEFPCESSSCDVWRPYMGETWSQPVIAKIRATVACTFGVDDPCVPEDRWVAIFGAGYDQAGDPNLPHETNSGSVQAGEYDASLDAGTSLAGRAIFMVDIASGEVFGVRAFQHDGISLDQSDGEPEMRYAVAARPAVFDLDRDGYADVVYVPDLGGNLWKWVIRRPVRDPVNDGSGDVEQPNWDFYKFFETAGCSACSPPHYRSFFFPPTGAKVGQNLWLAFGSGERNDFQFGRDGGLRAGDRNRFYVLKDSDPIERERNGSGLPFNDASGSGHVGNVTAISTTNPNTCLTGVGSVGFYIEGDEGEKFVTDTTIFFGNVLTGSFKPAPSGQSSCEAGGDAFLYGFGLFCGDGSLKDPGGGGTTERRISIGAGLPASPRVSVGPPGGGGGGGGGGGCSDMVVVITSEGEGFTDCPGGRPDSGITLKTWRD